MSIHLRITLISLLFLLSSSQPAIASTNPTNEELISYSLELFGDDMPHFYQIFGCESNRMQWKKNGEIVFSPTNDVGIAQINVPTWEAKAAELGLDIYNSWQDNLKMASYVYKKQSFKAWTCSRVLAIR